MSQETTKDYLGHPCRFTEAKNHFSDPFEMAKTMEQREIKRHVGALLLSLNERLSHALNASKALCVQAQSVDDSEELHALLEMLSEYQVSTSNIFYDFAGKVLAGFEDATSNPLRGVKK